MAVRPARRATLLSVAVLCLGCLFVAPSFVGGLRPASRCRVSRAAAMDEDEAKKTRGIFMSLDTEEFGIDEKAMSAPTEPREETVLDKAGDSAAGFGAVFLFTAALAGISYYVFFTKAAEDAFYYSGMRDRSARDQEMTGNMDFRDFDSNMTSELRSQQAPAPETDSPISGGL
mmetsp:Transcript_5191/g.14063  ORF Transcript_5191/g.14063 Transcript_5191/m.14063 type:complete len:173 (-) Transcript_5191:59-577(-)